MTDSPSDAPKDAAYQVLARKYRPSDFNTLIGQDAMVQTLKNAIDSDRLAHAFVLTGVRGVGKTTTARIIAKGLNCQNREGPSVDPCGECDSCLAISESRHVDVLEMDAASRTGIDDVREIIESVRYAPVSARYKIYIIDEVHMLSNQAFNGLLKTLEEPPAHVKFLFATTEIRKLPVTVLSRCQRFDLRRVEMPVLIQHLAGILEKENVGSDDEALAMIARAAEGSVRDSLSLLDQAIAHGAGAITATQVADMLGYADKAQVQALFEQVMKGDAGAALMSLRGLYDRGADPAVVISDLMDLTHGLTRLRVAPDAIGQDAMSDAEKAQLAQLGRDLAMPALTRAWQILLKGLSEVRGAVRPIAAAEMLLVRLAYASNLPDPASLVKKLQNDHAAGQHPVSAPNIGGQNTTATSAQSAGSGISGRYESMPQGHSITHAPRGQAATAQVLQLRTSDHDTAPQPAHPMPTSFEDMVALFHREKQPQLATMLSHMVRLNDYRPGHVSLSAIPGQSLPPTFLVNVRQSLKNWTGADWIFTLSNEIRAGAQSIREREVEEKAALLQQARNDKLAGALLEIWPDAKLVHVRDVVAEDIDMALTDKPANTNGGDEDSSGDYNADADDFEF